MSFTAGGPLDRPALLNVARNFARYSLRAGMGSAPRVAKKLAEHGLAQADIDAVIAEVAAERGKSIRRSGIKEIVGGILVFLLPVGLFVVQLAAGEVRFTVFHGLALAGIGMISHGFYQLRHARTFSGPPPVAGKAATRIGKQRKKTRGEG